MICVHRQIDIYSTTINTTKTMNKKNNILQKKTTINFLIIPLIHNPGNETKTETKIKVEDAE